MVRRGNGMSKSTVHDFKLIEDMTIDDLKSVSLERGDLEWLMVTNITINCKSKFDKISIQERGYVEGINK